MESRSTLPQPQWSDRLSTFLAGVLVLLGVWSILGWLLRSEALLQPLASMPAIKFNGALALLLIGLVLLGIEYKVRHAAWLALLPFAVSLLTLLQHLLGSNWHIDELITKDYLVVVEPHPGRISPVSALVLTLISATLCWRGQGSAQKFRILVEVVVASLACAAGISTLLGHTAGLPAVYTWGTSFVISPIMAIGMLVAGTATLVMAWRDAVAGGKEPPAWASIPAIVAGLTLTFVLWIGLREREQAYLSARTQTTMDTLAVQISSELERQANDIEKIARRWSDVEQNNPVIWEADAITLMSSAQAFGCDSVSYVSPEFRTKWFFPAKDNEDKIAFDHSLDPERSAALQLAANPNRQRPGSSDAVISATTQIAGKGSGVVIYAPVITKSRIAGYIAAEYLYAHFFRSLTNDLKITDDYDIAILISGRTVFNSNTLGQEISVTSLTLNRAYTIADRRIRINLTPSSAAMERDRRYLPELALISGFGITILLGLSIHLARSARAGQHEAELSNRRLLTENDERRRIEARLKTSDERLRLALDSTQIGIFERNVREQHVYYSPGLWAMLGYDHDRMPATVEAWQSLIHSDDLPQYRKLNELQLSGQAAFIDPEYRVRAQNGEWRWVYSRSKVVSTIDNRPTRIIGTVQDISARREAEQALRQSQAEARKLSLVASKTDNPVLICSPDGAIEWVNESFIRVMEYEMPEVIGRNPTEFLAGPDTNPRTILQIRQAMANGQGLATDLTNYSKSGRKYHLHLETQPIYNDAGRLENFIAILTDITTRVATENQLRRAKTEADATSRAKSEFLASMSHEIRTPMNGVIGMTSLLMETALTAEQRDYVNTIRTSGEALLTIINDILDFSKIESGKLELEHIPFDLSLCLEEAFDLFALQASSKKLELTYHIEPGVPAWIISDVTRLRQIIVNLVNNAVKFTPSGSISIVVRAPDSITDQGQLVEFVVRDTGIGIPPDRLDRLFKAFSQVDSSTTRKYGGTGLGLAISQRLCALMGGDIRVESKPGEGSVFTFSIRALVAEVPADYELPAPPQPLLEGSVLCIEPHPVTAAHLQSIFDQWKVPFRIASDTATAKALHASLGKPVSLFIINLDETENNSPLDDWAEITAPRLLMMPFGQSVPTGFVEDPLVGVTFKPLKTSALIHTVRQLFNPQGVIRRTGQSKAAYKVLAEKIPLDVLLVEDNAVNQKVALRFLERLGYRADAVGNGIEAVTAVESRHYHLVFMDIQMPEMDGFEASRQIRRRIPADRQPKIVALTANAMQGDRELCLAAGMDDYISKPVKLHEIDAVVRRLFSSDSSSPLIPGLDDQDHISA